MLKSFLRIFDGIEPNIAPSQAAEKIIDRSDYLNHLRKVYDANEAETKIENVREFIQSTKQFEVFSSTPDDPTLGDPVSTSPTLESFLHEIALLQEKISEAKDSQDHVQLMTLHAVKGLEFDTVIITGLEEGLLPSSRSLYSTAALEEERRLFYVGMTRAKERLLLFNSEYRNTYGTMTDQLPSRFTKELPPKLIYHIDSTELPAHRTAGHLCEWMGYQQQASSLITFGTPARRSVATRAASIRSFLPKTSASSNSIKSVGAWQRNQPVSHKTFGVGVIKTVDKRGENDYHLTISFKIGEKKISSKFITRI